MDSTEQAFEPGSPEEDATNEAIQRRTVMVLMAATIPAGMSLAGAFPVTSPLGKELTGSDTWGGFVAACLTVGAAVTAVPLARYMTRHGRRPGLQGGWMIAVVGAVFAVIASEMRFFPLLVVAAFLIGSGNATSLSARYAASDLAAEERKAKTIGTLVWASTFGSVLGPTISTGPAAAAAEFLGLEEETGAYGLALLGFLIAATVSGRLLRPDPLVVAGGVDPDATGSNRPPISESFRELASVPIARLAAIAMATGHAVMVGVMTMTPIHMENGNHELRIVGFVISLHIVGMYAFSPIVGWLVDRLGARPIIALGGIVLFIGAEMASHTDPEDSLGVFVGLFLIGLGWSFGLIAGSSILASAFPAEKRAVVQGASDLIMVGAGAGAALVSGFIVDRWDYHFLSHWAGVSALILPVLAGLAIVANRHNSPGSPGPLDPAGVGE